MGFSELIAKREYRGVQRIVSHAQSLKREYLEPDDHDDKMFPWVQLPYKLLGDLIFDVRETSDKMSQFVKIVETVWHEVLPEFELKVSRFTGVLTAQKQFVESAQNRVIACIAGAIW